MKSPSVDVEDVYAIHARSIEMFGGADGVRDVGLLESAVAQPWQTFDGFELYPTPEEKACRLAFGIVSNRPFVDGNKRTGAACLGAALRMSGFDFSPDPSDFLNVMLSCQWGTGL